MSLDRETILTHTRHWLEHWVIGLNLCPFARKPYEAGRVQLTLSYATSVFSLQDDIEQVLEQLCQTPAEQLETTVLILPKLLADFNEYLDCLSWVEDLIVEAGLEGHIQVASFHPDYCFADTPADAPSNLTNRSPYPLLHFLREDSLAQLLAKYPNPEAIPAANIAKMRLLSAEEKQRLNWGEPRKHS